MADCFLSPKTLTMRAQAHLQLQEHDIETLFRALWEHRLLPKPVWDEVEAIRRKRRFTGSGDPLCLRHACILRGTFVAILSVGSELPHRMRSSWWHWGQKSSFMYSTVQVADRSGLGNPQAFSARHEKLPRHILRDGITKELDSQAKTGV